MSSSPKLNLPAPQGPDSFAQQVSTGVVLDYSAPSPGSVSQGIRNQPAPGALSAGKGSLKLGPIPHARSLKSQTSRESAKPIAGAERVLDQGEASTGTFQCCLPHRAS